MIDKGYQASKQIELLVKIAIGALERTAGVHTLDRRQFLRGVKVALSSAQVELMTAAFVPSERTESELGELCIKANACFLMTYATLRLMENPSTQWDDPELLIEQFKHAVRTEASTISTVDPKTGEPISRAGQ